MTETTIGVDISKDHLEVHRWPDGAAERFRNERTGHRALHGRGARCAVPVGARQAVQALGAVADLVVCLSSPEPFIAVGGAYEDFRQLSDEEVVEILKRFST